MNQSTYLFNVLKACELLHCIYEHEIQCLALKFPEICFHLTHCSLGRKDFKLS